MRITPLETGEIEMRRAWRGEGIGRGERLRLEAATGRKTERRRRWSVVEKGSGREREVVAIAAAATDSMGGDGERSEVRCGRRQIFFLRKPRKGNSVSFLKERVRINGDRPHLHSWSVSGILFFLENIIMKHKYIIEPKRTTTVDRIFFSNRWN
jgi:hypothetical protein